MSRLATGPAAAMSASSRARFGSSSRFAAPPKMKSVMLVTRTPKRLATRAWLSSWASTLAKKSRLVAPATTQYSGRDQPGNWSGNCDAASE